MLPLRPLRQLLFATVGTLVLTACDPGDSPSQSWEVAAKGLYSGTLSNDASLAVVGSIAHGGSLWRVDTDERLFDWNHREGEQTEIIATGFSPDGNFALTANHQTMVLWNTQDGAALTFWSAPNEVFSVDLTPNGNLALLGLGDYSAVLFDVKRGGIRRTFYHQDRVRSVALSADGALAVTGSEDETARLWDVQSGSELFRWTHNDEVLTVALSPDGSRVLSVSKYDKVAVWNAQTGELIWELPLKQTALRRGQTFTAAEFSADGSQLLTGNSDRSVQLWDLNTQRELAHWSVPKRDPWKPTSATILSLSFGSDGHYYALSSNGFLHRLEWEGRTPQPKSPAGANQQGLEIAP